MAAEDLLDGRYRIREVLGRGAFGTVHAAEHVLLGRRFRDVAVKFFGPGPGGAGPPAAHTVLEEAVRITGLVDRATDPAVRHAFVTIHDVGVGEHPYLVMERARGDLASHVEGAQLPVPIAREHLTAICRAVAYLHEHAVVHLDLKPANVVVDPSGTLKVADYGAAARLSEIAAGDRPRGTLVYQAPEVLADRPPTPAADVYSLGLIGYELLTGRLPDHERLRELAGGPDRAPRLRDLLDLKRQPVPPPGAIHPLVAGDPLEAVLLRALDPLVTRRYPDAGALLRALSDESGPAVRVAGAAPVAELVGDLGATLSRTPVDRDRLADLVAQITAAQGSLADDVTVPDLHTAVVRALRALGRPDDARRHAQDAQWRRAGRDSYRAMAIAFAGTGVGAAFERRSREVRP